MPLHVSENVNSGIKILNPRDWGRLQTTSFTVAIEGECTKHKCIIWRFEDFPLKHDPLAEAPVCEHSSGLWTARFDAVEAWGKCILGVVLVGADLEELVACNGLQIGVSEETRLLKTSRSPQYASQAIIYPLPILCNDLSNVSIGDTNIPFHLVAKDAFYAADPSAGNGATLFLVLDDAEHNDAQSCMLLDYCVGAVTDCFQDYYRQSKWSSAKSYAAIFLRADLYVAPGLPLTQQGIWGDAAFASVYYNQDMGHYPELFRYKDAIGRAGLGSFVAIQDKRIAFMLSNAGFGNIAHWIMNSLMAAFVMRDDIVEHDMILVSPVLPGYARESIRLLGLGDRLYETPDLQLSFDRIVYTSYLSTHFNMMPASSALNMVAALKAAAACDPSFIQMEAPELLYLTRRGAASSRNFCNELEFTQKITCLGFREVATHDLTFVQKIRVMSKARIIVAQLGAALAHIAFAPRGCVVVEITTKSFHSNEYWYLAEILGLKFVRFIGEEDPATFANKMKFDFNIDVGAAISQLRRLLEANGGAGANRREQSSDLIAF